MSDNSMTVTANPIAIDMDVGTVVAPNPNTPREFIITVYRQNGSNSYALNKNANEIWQAVRRGDQIWIQMGLDTLGQQSIQRAVVTYNEVEDYQYPNQLTATFAGNFGQGYGFYIVYYVSGLGLIVNFKAAALNN